jgi:hypothetical protein
MRERSSPGNIGGMAWGGTAHDRDHDLLIILTNRLVAEVWLIPRASFEQRSEGRRFEAIQSLRRSAARLTDGSLWF